MANTFRIGCGSNCGSDGVAGRGMTAGTTVAVEWRRGGVAVTGAV